MALCHGPDVNKCCRIRPQVGDRGGRQSSVRLAVEQSPASYPESGAICHGLANHGASCDSVGIGPPVSCTPMTKRRRRQSSSSVVPVPSVDGVSA